MLQIQPKSKIKAGDGLTNGIYPFYTCSIDLTKSINTADYEGDSLVFGTGGSASVHYASGKFSTSTDCLVYKSDSDINLSLINKYLRTNIYLLENGFKGAGLKHISRDYIANIEIPLPSYSEQNKLVKQFDSLESIIAKHKLMLEKYDTLIKSRFIEMFGDNPIENGKWNIEKLEDVCTVTSSKRIYAEEQSTSGVPFLRISDLVSRINGNPINDLFIPNSKFKEFQTKGLVPSVDDILITSRGTLGLCYIIKPEDKFYFQDGMITWLAFENHNKVLSVFIDWLFKSVLKTKIDNETNGATVKYVSISDLKKLQIPVPQIELQNDFAAFVLQIDKSKFAVQKSLEKAETLYKALMQQYFG